MSSTSNSIIKSLFMAYPLIMSSMYLKDTFFPDWNLRFVEIMVVTAGLTLITTVVGKCVLGNGVGDEKGTGDSRIYGLEHGRLSLELPARSMWMNMGFWKDTKHFPTACKNLLHEVLCTANFAPLEQIKLLDLGFGCGDQTLELVNLGMKSGYESTHKHLDPSSTSSKPIITEYTGITLNPTQFAYAQTRLTNPNSKLDTSRAKIFCADAADPSTWPDELHAEHETIHIQHLHEIRDQTQPEKLGSKYWALALDSMYHFKPSRTPILKYVHDYLGASVMAFDLLVSEKATWYQRLLLSLIATLMGCPMNTFMAESKYREMLGEVGYLEENVEMRDISEYCFAPLAEFLEQRERELKVMGLGLGRLSVAKWMFGWWGRSGIVRGTVIIARI